jgi:hypothetical protein
MLGTLKVLGSIWPSQKHKMCLLYLVFGSLNESPLNETESEHLRTHPINLKNEARRVIDKICMYWIFSYLSK